MRRPSLRLGLLAIVVVALAAACGGGGGGGGSPAASTPPNPLYVAPNGQDANLGDIDHPLATLNRAAQITPNGYTIIVAPGTYHEAVTTERRGSVEARSLSIIADVTGTSTQRAAGPVVIDATGTGAAAAFAVSNSAGTEVDGFTVLGGAKYGILVTSDANDVQIRNCVVHDNADDGIHVQDSSNVVIFNNLVYNNQGSGVAIVGQSLGSQGAHLINNTLYNNQFRGITVGTSTKASQNAFARNNIVQNSGDPTIRVLTPPPPSVPRSDIGYDADFNLVLPANYEPTTIAGRHDVKSDALFVNAGAGDFHLRAGSPAINAGDSLIGMQELANALRGRTTTGGNDCDKSAIDIGYHYRIASSCTAAVP